MDFCRWAGGDFDDFTLIDGKDAILCGGFVDAAACEAAKGGQDGLVGGEDEGG